MVVWTPNTAIVGSEEGKKEGRKEGRKETQQLNTATWSVQFLPPNRAKLTS